MSSRPSPSSDFATEFPGLAHLAGAYLGQLYEYVDGSPQEAVRSFARNEPALVANAVDGIELLLRDYPDEVARLQVLRGLSWAYSPDAGDLDAFLRWASAEMTRKPSESVTG